MLIQPKQDAVIALPSSSLIRKALKHNGHAVEICKCRTDKLLTHVIPGLPFSICSPSCSSRLKNSSLFICCTKIVKIKAGLKKKQKNHYCWSSCAVGKERGEHRCPSLQAAAKARRKTRRRQLLLLQVPKKPRKSLGGVLGIPKYPAPSQGYS